MAMTLSNRRSKAVQAKSKAPEFENAFEALFQQHWNRLCAVLFRIVGDPDEAQDLALEAFVQLYRRPPRDDRNLGGWLYRVATNLGLNALRARKRRQQYEQQAGVLALENEPPEDPAMAVERAQERERVRATLSEMKTRSAQVLLLRHSGLSYAEIAAAVGVSPGSVGKLLARAEREFERKFTKLSHKTERRR
jgi:RNA polymerase sigma-70 factor (ECF subfamily)